jgi:hypothetical protein
VLKKVLDDQAPITIAGLVDHGDARQVVDHATGR